MNVYSSNMFKFVVLCALVASAAAFSVPRPRLDGRIVGGRDTEITEYPHQISLQSSGYHICGGSIIGDQWVVTAAHCTDGSSARSLSIRAGITNLNEEGQLVKIAKIHQHPDFSMWDIDYDISVLELDSSITLGANAQPVQLAADGFDPEANSEVTCTGWGALREGGSSPDILQEVQVKITSRKQCREQYGKSAITEQMICAGVPEGGKDACQGDSGGPLVGEGKLVGIVSWGSGCARPGLSGVYSNVGALRSFIKKQSGI